ncbi:sugar-binding protein, partial [Pelomonas sp. HMWF004]
MNANLALLALLTLAATAHADDFPRFDEALPRTVDIRSNYPVFDFDTDGCLPSAGVARDGRQNGGLKASGNITAGCRAGNFLDLSNTLHRHACLRSGVDTYCGHFYALYF